MRKVINLITLDPSAIVRVLVATAAFLILASLAGLFSTYGLGHGSLKGLVWLFDLDQERNIPTFFSVLLLLFATLLLAVIAVLKWTQKAPHVSKWVILSCGFLLMAFDEGFSAHERLIPPIRELLGDGHLGIFHFAWVIPGIALVLVIGLSLLNFLLHLPSATRLRFILAAALYLAGALGIELIGGHYAELHGTANATYGIVTTLEESAEMAGLILFIRALLKYCADYHAEVQLLFEAEQATAGQAAPSSSQTATVTAAARASTPHP